MNKTILKSMLFMPILGFIFYNDINWVTGISGASVYIIYNFFYTLSVNNRYFSITIAPNNYIDPINESHKLIAYGFSTIHAIYISFYTTLYLYQIIDNYAIKQANFISMCYYLSDLYYVIYSTKKLTKLEYFTICHHNIMIYCQMFVFIQNDYDVEKMSLYYLNRGYLAEYSVISLNYSWYLINTNQGNSRKMIISSIITLILYFITRVINFTLLIYNLSNDGYLLMLMGVMPLFLINYYWFYKLFSKAYRIYRRI